MVEWFAANPLAMGVVTFLLMWSDWLLTVLQERERRLHCAEHYLSYPVNTIEGNPYYQEAVSEKRLIEPRHIIPALAFSALAAGALVLIPKDVRALFIGYMWGLFLIVDTTRIGNLIGYQAGGAACTANSSCIRERDTSSRWDVIWRWLDSWWWSQCFPNRRL